VFVGGFLAVTKNRVPDPRFIELPPDFPMTFFIRARPEKKGPYVAVPHVHDCLEVGYCHEGAGVFVIGDKILPFKTGDVVIINQSEAHYGQNAAGVESIWTWIYFDPVRLLGPVAVDQSLADSSRFRGRGFNNVLCPAKYSGIDSLMELIIKEERQRKPHYQDALRGYVAALLSQFHRVPGGSKPARPSRMSPDAAHRLGPALQFMHEHYREPISLGQLAAKCFMSTSHFRKSFRQVLGKTPYQFILAYRISMAMIELRLGVKTCSAVAMDNGFPTLSSFVRKFRSTTGVSPRAWAKQAQ
jgi:AraC-like DNA-binding protein